MELKSTCFVPLSIADKVRIALLRNGLQTILSQEQTMHTTRMREGMDFINLAQALAGLSHRAYEIVVASCLHSADIDPDHFGGPLSTCMDLDNMGIYDDKIVELFDNLCCGCHVNLRTRLRARNLALVSEEGFWAPDLSVEHYLKLVQRKLPRFAKGMAIITARQKASEPPAPPTPEQIAESAAIADAANVCLGVHPASSPSFRTITPTPWATDLGSAVMPTIAQEQVMESAAIVANADAMVRVAVDSSDAPPADLGPRYQARMWMPSHERDQAKACGPVRGTAEEAERDLEPYRGNVMVEQHGEFVLHKYVHGAQWESTTPPEGFVLS